MPSPIRMGVIGLSRRWLRYRQALLALPREVQVVAVHDPGLERTAQEARDLDCEAVGSALELIERDDVQALLVAGGTWHGYWSVQRAAERGKPVLCAVSPVEDEVHLEELPTTANIHLALWPTLEFACEVLMERLSPTVGRPLFLQATWTRQGDGDLLNASGTLALLHIVGELFGSAPRQVSALPSPATVDCACLLLQFDEQRLAQLTCWSGPAARSSLRVQVEAEDGSAALQLPRSLEWHDGDGRHTFELPGGLAEAVFVDRFLQAVREGEAPTCGVAEAIAALGWLRAARQSRESGHPVVLSNWSGRS